MLFDILKGLLMVGTVELHAAEATDWVVVPEDAPASEDYFACQVTGESMNRVIPNGATCLFRVPTGGSRQ